MCYETQQISIMIVYIDITVQGISMACPHKQLHFLPNIG